MSRHLPVKIVAAIIFFALMYGVRKAAPAIVDLGVLPWFIALGAIFWLGIKIENRIRHARGDEPYSISESRELIIPLGAFCAIMAVAYLVR